MELYTLDEHFQPQVVIDDFVSVIWTERFTKAGDVELVVKPTSQMMAALPEGTFLQTKDSKEVMQIETALVENELLKLTGPSLTGFFNNRHTLGHLIDFGLNYAIETGKAGWIMGDIVSEWCTIPSLTLDQLISNLTLGDIDVSGPDLEINVPNGPILDFLTQMADTYGIGFSLYLDSITPPAGYALKFTTYAGRDLTSAQSTYPVVKFSPNMDTLTDIKQLKSISGYKNVSVVFSSDEAGPLIWEIAYADGAAMTSVDFDRRILVAYSSEAGSTDDIPLTEAQRRSILQKIAQDNLANNNYTKVLDGQVVPQSQYTYGVDYKMGDIVELDAYDSSQYARITEYIRSQDKEGEKAYPTVSVIT